MEAFDMSIFDKMFEPQVAPVPNRTNISDMITPNPKQQVLSAETRTPFPKETPIGMAYVPFQQWEKPYDDAVGFVRGTIFPSLDKPFIGEEAVKNERKR